MLIIYWLGKLDYEKYKRNVLSLKMETCLGNKSKGKHPGIECSQGNITSEESARKVETDSCHNNAPLNPVSFMSVHSKKLMCHNFSLGGKDFENKTEEPSPDTNIHSANPLSFKCNIDQNDRPSQTTKTRIRRRSVGFEDMTFAANYGQNFSNERRFQALTSNSNVSAEAVSLSGNVLHFETENGFRKHNSVTTLNQNMQNSSENENNVCQRNDRCRQKDKSSKRKSSLNRIDFIHIPSPNLEYTNFKQNSLKQKNSSSDDGSEVKHLQSLEFVNSKRKHSATNINHSVSSSPERKSKEVLPSLKIKSNLLPRTVQNNHSKLHHPRWKQFNAVQSFQKLSHSAGELESLSDYPDRYSCNKICLSAQEFDGQGFCDETFVNKNYSASSAGKNSSNQNSLNICDKTSQNNSFINKKYNDMTVSNIVNPQNIEIPPSENSCISSNCFNHNQLEEKILNIPNKSLELSELSFGQKLTVPCTEKEQHSNTVDCSVIDYQEVHNNTIKLSNLEISVENNESIEDCPYVDDNDLSTLDGEKKVSSILRKKFFEEKKELHSILKPPPEDKLSRTPPSILKHRESSEEKESWSQPDLHSILKKSTSEEESCSSGPDIRPILKVSTDEESPGGSVMPRPILKKRTSFSDECYHASFSSGELKPILKKKTPLNFEDQPRPILKSRRKSEDTRSTMTEFIASRPRAYSADMGIKSNHDVHSNDAEFKKSH